MSDTKKGKQALPSVSCIAVLKKAGKTAAHFWDNEEGGFCKDIYVPTAEFEALGKPDKIEVTIQVAK